MITLTMKCSRCSKEVSQDMTNGTLSNELVRKFGFVYLHNGKTNALLCDECEELYKELKARLEEQLHKEMCGFLCTKEGKDGEKGKSESG
jgi:hypothetical protein